MSNIRDKEALKLKIMDILRKELSDEEYLMIQSVQTKMSPKDLREEQLYEQMIQKELDKERQEREQIILDTIDSLAADLGLGKLNVNGFTRGVAEHFIKYGNITDKQKGVLPMNESRFG